MAFWTVIGTGIVDDLQGKSFGLSLNTDDETWTVGGPSVDKFFTTKSGAYKIALIPEKGLQLLNSHNEEAAFFTNLVGTSAVGDKGSGRATEKGVNFNWKLDSK